MAHMATGLLEYIGWIAMIQPEVLYLWIHLTRGVMLMDFILAPIMRDIITITTNIFIGGARRDIFQYST